MTHRYFFGIIPRDRTVTLYLDANPNEDAEPHEYRNLFGVMVREEIRTSRGITA